MNRQSRASGLDLFDASRGRGKSGGVKLGPVDGALEREADAVADRVVGAPDRSLYREMALGAGRSSSADRSVAGHVTQGAPAARGAIQRDPLDAAADYLTEDVLDGVRDVGVTGLGVAMGGLGVASDMLDIATIAATTSPVEAIFDGVVITNRAVADRISIPGEWLEAVARYAVAAPDDGAILTRALLRMPSFWSGGWILDTQGDAAAMTLDRSVFVSGDLSLKTFVHELVHVWQYTVTGITGFLVSYFGASGATIAYRWTQGEDLEPMKSSPHEVQAYELADRFNGWYAEEYGTTASRVTA